MLSFKLFRPYLWHLLVTSLFFSMIESRSWASRPDDPKPCGERNLVHDRERYEPADSAAELFSSQVGTIPASHLQPSHASSLLCLTQFPKSLFSDQKAIWASPFHLRTRDESWILPMGITLLGLFASDTTIMRHMGDSALPHSNSFSNYAVAGMIGAAATMYLRGVATQDEHSRETGVSAAEAAIDSAILGEVMKVTFGRSRPNATNAGSFRAGGASFPSEHALAAWSLASVVAQEYPGTLTKFVAYGGAAGISIARVAARQHFPSDVVVGSLLGYAVGHYVYRAHHDPALAGASNSSYQKLLAEKAPPRRRTPAELGSPYVPIDSWAYPAFDRLAALGYVPSAYANLRPWTRMECARLVVATDEDLLIDAPRIDLPVHYADNDFPTAHGPANDAPAKNQRIGGAGAGKKSSTEAERIAIALRTEFAGEILLIEDRDKSVDESASDSEIRVEEIYSRYFGIAGTPLDDSYHFGQTLINDFGRPYGQGSNTIEGAAASGSSGPAAFYVRGEYQHAAALPVYSLAVQQMLGEIDLTTPQLPIHTATLDQFRLLDAYAAWNFKTVQVSAGRQSLWWGPGRGGPPNFSDNAEPMDMLRLTNPSPWLLPGFLHWLGPMRWDFFLGLMAGHHFPHEPGIDGQKLSFKPTPNLEFGFSRTIVFRPVTLHMFWRGFSSFGDNKTTIPGSAADVGDRRGEIGDQRGVRRRNPEPGQPGRHDVERRAGRRGQRQGRERALHNSRDDPVDAGAEASGPVQQGDQTTDAQSHRVEQQQHIEEPQVGQREGRETRIRRRRRQRTAVRRHHRAPDGHRDDRGEQDRPADHQRHGDPLQPVDDEPLGPAPVEGQMREEAGDQEEGGHPKGVQQVEQRMR